MRILCIKKITKTPEATFFLSACYGLKARHSGERGKWVNAVSHAKKSLKYLQMNDGNEDLNPEFLLGSGLYNYYSEYLVKEYGKFRAAKVFFKKGNKELGIKQLQRVSREAFYARTEAKIYLMDIYDNEKRYDEYFQLAKTLYHSYPNNSYFHKSYCRSLYSRWSKNSGNARMKLTEDLIKDCTSMLKSYDDKKFGYDDTGARYATFYLGSAYYYKGNTEKAKVYLERNEIISTEIEAEKMGYYHLTLGYLARIYKNKKEYEKADKYYEKMLDYTKRKHSMHDEAVKFRKEFKQGKFK